MTQLLLVQDWSSEMCLGFTEMVVGVQDGEEAMRGRLPQYKHILLTSLLHSFAIAVSRPFRRGGGFL